MQHSEIADLLLGLAPPACSYDNAHIQAHASTDSLPLPGITPTPGARLPNVYHRGQRRTVVDPARLCPHIASRAADCGACIRAGGPASDRKPVSADSMRSCARRRRSHGKRSSVHWLDRPHRQNGTSPNPGSDFWNRFPESPGDVEREPRRQHDAYDATQNSCSAVRPRRRTDSPLPHAAAHESVVRRLPARFVSRRLEAPRWMGGRQGP